MEILNTLRDFFREFFLQKYNSIFTRAATAPSTLSAASPAQVSAKKKAPPLPKQISKGQGGR